jgi:hypothetical protein
MGQHWVAIYLDANSRGEYYDPTGTPPFLSAYINFMSNIVRFGRTIPFEYKKKDLPCVDINAFITWFNDVQDLAWHTSPGS